jgi:hypothetical protein
VDFLVTSGHGSPLNLAMPFGLGSLVSWSNRLYATTAASHPAEAE